jgi:ligand-binding SRPBCC domain-containing protein
VKKELFICRSHLKAPAREVFDWHARPGAFERYNPPWAPVKVIERSGGIEDGARIVLRMPLGPFSTRWVAEHGDYEPGRQFRDVQVRGPFAHWSHLHRVEPDGPEACFLEDRIEYAPPLGRLGRWLGGAFLRKELGRTFAYRHRTLGLDLEAHQRYRDRPRLRVAVSGGEGLLGSTLIPFLTTGGHRVTQLGPGQVEGVDAVVHLEAAESLRPLCESLARLERPPRTLVCAFAGSCPGEEVIAAVRERGVRVVLLRVGTILDPRRGLLRQMLRWSRYRLAGPLGDEGAWLYWVGVDDVAGTILHALMTEGLHGPVDVASPHPVTRGEMARVLAGVLGRRVWLRLPGSAGQTSGPGMDVTSLLASGYVFRDPHLEEALRHLLGRRTQGETCGGTGQECSG